MDFGTCDAELQPVPEWGSTAAAAPLTGTLELGQTHVVRAQPTETRLAPRLVSEREALVLFTPDAPLGEGEVRVRVRVRVRARARARVRVRFEIGFGCGSGLGLGLDAAE